MKFMCLICAEVVMEMMEPSFAEEHFQEYGEFTKGIKASGNFVSANRLTPASTATTIRVRDGKVQKMDGPFAETREQVGGYYVIEAKNLDEAVVIASKIPGARYGCVEIRSIADDAQTRALGFERSNG